MILSLVSNEFIEGAIKTSGADRVSMEKFWAQLEDFAAYCFNKSHAACYGLIAYQTAYLKAHYPDAFMAALMTSDYDNTDRLAIEITECKQMGIEVLPPDINESFHEFAIVPNKNQIRFGLDAIKNVGHGAAEEIIRAREEAGGRLQAIEDYCKYVSCHIVNRKALESLIKSGAFDNFGNRSALVNNIENILSLAQRVQKDSNSGQVGLFGEEQTNKFMPRLSLDDTEHEYPQSELLAWERELLGIYLSSNPIEAYVGILAAQTRSIASLTGMRADVTVKIGGAINTVREITTKNGSKMAFVRLTDLSGDMEVVIFPKVYEKTADIWQKDNIIIAKGKIGSGRGASQDSSETKVLIDEVKLITLEDAKAHKYISDNDAPKALSAELTPSSYQPISKQRLYIRLEDSSNQPLLLTLKERIDTHKGNTEVVLVTGETSNKQIIKLPQQISINEESLRDLASIFGSTNVIVR
jgi:DNA polymerase-3 subunit alpha